jgi:riboflavin synthase
MFTGIVTAVGRIVDAAPSEGGLELRIECPFADLEPGESVAVDGACLTVERVAPGSFTAHVIRTSLDRTAFGLDAGGRRVNLERALRVGDRLGGHLVQGHVDGVGTVASITDRDDARVLDIEVPAAVAAVSIPLGSVTVDGVSLTVNAVPAPGVVQVSLIPFTLQHTTLGERRPGDRVHLEGDTIGKYVREMLGERRQP